MIVPSARWLRVAAALGLVAAAAVWIPAAAVVWLVASGLWLIAGVLDALAVVRRRADVTVERDGPSSLSIGRPGSVRFLWSSPPGAVVRVLETPPSAVEVLEPLDRVLHLRPGRELVEERTLVPVARVREQGWRFDLRVAGPLGLVWRQRTLETGWPTTIYPRLRDAAFAQLPSQTRLRREAGQRRIRRIGEGRLFESLREWRPGDELRSIDWKATGRRGKLIARQYEDERRQRVMLALDAGRMLTAESDGRARLEDAIEAVAQLAYRAVALDDDVGLLVFSDAVDAFLPPARGQRALRAILDVLAGVEGRLVEPDYPAAFAFLATQTRKRALTVVFTDVIDRFASDALVSQVTALRPRHLPVAVAIRDTALERLASSPAADVDRAFERAAAEQLLQARSDALAELRSRGVVLVDAAPDGVARAVVDCYLRLKRRALV